MRGPGTPPMAQVGLGSQAEQREGVDRKLISFELDTRIHDRGLGTEKRGRRGERKTHPGSNDPPS